MILGFADGIYAFWLFLFVGVIFAIITIAVIKHNMSLAASVTPKANNNKYEFRFKGKYLWDNAASEYMQIHGLTDISELTEEDNNKIYDYDDRGIFDDKQSYVYDYCDATESMGEAYYCIDFSWDLADHIYKIIEQRYEDYNKRLYRYDRVDFYEESEEVEGVTRTFLFEKFNCQIDVRRAGPIYTGNITAEYVDKCIEALKNLSEIQIDKLRRWFGGIYDDMEGDMESLFYFEDDLTLYVMDPKEEGDVVFTMSGGTVIYPEHGLSWSFT